MKKMSSSGLALVTLATLAVMSGGCPTSGDGDDGNPDADAGPTGPEPVCTTPADSVPCRDQSLVALEMTPEDVTDGAITNEAIDGGFHSDVDATAGGFPGTLGYVYGRFTDDGLEKVTLTDDESFASMDWDIAFRRFVIRLNSGTGGPSCVTGARTAPSTDFAALDAVPEGLDFNAEQFMSEGTCDIIPDGSGLGSPGTVLQNFWTYPGCVQMTGNIYVVQLASGRHVKLVVTHYYNEVAQEECQQDGTTSTMPNGSGNIQLDWAFLD